MWLPRSRPPRPALRPSVKLLRESLWRWSAAHPDWEPSDDWPQQVSCFAHVSATGLVVIDPLLEVADWGPLDELAERHGGVAAVLVTVFWHARDAGAAAERYGAALYAPRLGTAQPSLAGAHPIEEGGALPGGIQPVLAPLAAEALLYLPAARTLVAGDALVARQDRLGLCPASWLDREADLEAVRADVRRALELPLEAVAVSHGEPPLFDRAALEAAVG